jgi:hypothetical protein
VVDAKVARQRLGDCAVRAVADEEELDAARLAVAAVAFGPDAVLEQPVEDTDDIRSPLDFAEVGVITRAR